LLLYIYIYFRLNKIKIILKLISYYKLKKVNIGDWGLGIGDCGLGIGPNPQSPIHNPQSPIPKSPK